MQRTKMNFEQELYQEEGFFLIQKLALDKTLFSWKWKRPITT